MASLVPNRITPVPQSFFSEAWGGGLISSFVMHILVGIWVIQSYLYFLNYPKDSLYLKSTVTGVVIVGLVHAIIVDHSIYYRLVISYTDPILTFDGLWSSYTTPGLAVMIIILVQTFFIKTIFQLTTGLVRWVLTLILIACLCVQSAFGIYVVIRFCQLWEVPKLGAVVYPIMVPLLTTTVFNDALTSVTLCYILHESKTEFKGSIALIRKLITFAMNRFVLTTVVVFCQLIVLVTRPNSLAALEMEFLVPHLYINSLLTTLNTRNYLRSRGSGNQSYLGPASSRTMNSSTAGSQGPHRIACNDVELGDIHMSQGTVKVSDFDSEKTYNGSANYKSYAIGSQNRNY